MIRATGRAKQKPNLDVYWFVRAANSATTVDASNLLTLVPEFAADGEACTAVLLFLLWCQCF